jgi:hypothetical protein
MLEFPNFLNGAFIWHSTILLSSFTAWWQYGNRAETENINSTVAVISTKLVQKFYEEGIIKKTSPIIITLDLDSDYSTEVSQHSPESEKSREILLSFLLQNNDLILDFCRINKSERKWYCYTASLKWMILLSVFINIIGLLPSGICSFIKDTTIYQEPLLLFSIVILMFTSFMILLLFPIIMGLTFYHHNIILKLRQKYNANR